MNKIKTTTLSEFVFHRKKNKEHHIHLSDEKKQTRDQILSVLMNREEEFKAKYGDNWKEILNHVATRLALSGNYEVQDTEPSAEPVSEAVTCDTISDKNIKDLETFADRLLSKFGVDVEFSKHFADRMTDERNKPCIKVAELQQLFKKVAKDKAKKIQQYPNKEAVLKDIQSDLNLPFVLKLKADGEFEMLTKTIMRKKNFHTPDPEVKYEEASITINPVKHEKSILQSAMKGNANKKKKLMTTLPENSPLVNYKAYENALKAMKKEIDKCKSSNNGVMRHGLAYYAQTVASDIQGIDPEKLAQNYEGDFEEMSKAPSWAPNAIATPQGWVDPKTKELLVAVRGLVTTVEVKNPVVIDIEETIEATPVLEIAVESAVEEKNETGPDETETKPIAEKRLSRKSK